MATQIYCDYQAVLQRVADGLHTAVANVGQEWLSLCSQATKDASSEIKRIFVLKGFTPAQLASSDDIKVWCERLAAFFTFCRGTALCNYDLKSVEYLDCRKEMSEAGTLIVGDVPITPGGTDIGGISHGRVTAADCDAERFERW